LGQLKEALECLFQERTYSTRLRRKQEGVLYLNMALDEQPDNNFANDGLSLIELQNKS
jgi:hypothetical protein